METSITGLSLDFILHPGMSIKEKLEENNMKQEELAERTGFSAKHVSEVKKKKKGISPKFAKALEYVFGVKFTFWLKRQKLLNTLPQTCVLPLNCAAAQTYRQG